MNPSSQPVLQYIIPVLQYIIQYSQYYKKASNTIHNTEYNHNTHPVYRLGPLKCGPPNYRNLLNAVFDLSNGWGGLLGSYRHHI